MAKAKILSIIAFLFVLTLPSLPAAAADRSAVAARGSRYVVARMHYYDAYPWWWHPPYAHRARTNYQPWPYFVRDPDYDRPNFDGVVGYRIF